MTYTDVATVEVIAAAIEAEQSFVYAAGLTGAYLRGGGRRRAVQQLSEHQGRIQVLSMMIDPGAVPPTPPGFTPPTPITDARSARGALAELHNSLVGVYAGVAAATTGDDRAFAIASAQNSARAAVQWGAPSQAFPS